MLENGTIVYNVSERSFLDRQFKSEGLNVVFSAVLTTMLAYQLSAICYNIFLGWKPKGTATASDFHKLILSEASSPLSVLAAVTRNDTIDRLRFKRDIPANVRIARRGTSVTKKGTLSLLTLLFVAPLFNLISIFIVLQGDETLTFGKARFSGVALGVTNGELTLFDETILCDRVAMRLDGAPSTPISQFSVCYETRFNPTLNMSGTTLRFSIETTFEGLINFEMRTLPKDLSASIGIVLDMATHDQLYRTKPMVDSTGAIEMLTDGQKKLAEYCDAAGKEFPLDSLNITETSGVLKVSKDFECNLPEMSAYFDVLPEMLNRLGVVDEIPFRVVNVKDLKATSAPTYFDASSLPFLVRRTRNASVTLLSIILGVSVVLRIITSVLFHNDVDEGIEAVVRYRLGTEPHESLLNSSRTVRYNTKRQDGATAHYGLQRSRLPEVDKFGDGIEIGLEENTWTAKSRRGW